MWHAFLSSSRSPNSFTKHFQDTAKPVHPTPKPDIHSPVLTIYIYSEIQPRLGRLLDGVKKGNGPPGKQKASHGTRILPRDACHPTDNSLQPTRIRGMGRHEHFPQRCLVIKVLFSIPLGSTEVRLGQFPYCSILRALPSANLELY